MKLAQYIQQVDDKVNQELEKDLKDNIALGRKKTCRTLFKNPGSGRAGAERSAYPSDSGSVAVCESGAGDKKPQIQQTQDVTQDTMFLLGSEALESMIKHEATARWCSHQTTIRLVKTCWISTILTLINLIFMLPLCNETDVTLSVAIARRKQLP